MKRWALSVALRAILPGAHIFVFDGVYPGAASVYAAARLMP